jgi:hypothetical protein
VDLSAGSLFAGLLVGTVGTGLFLYGKKSLRPPHLVSGLALMALPMVVPGAALELGLAGLLVLGLWVAVRTGL